MNDKKVRILLNIVLVALLVNLVGIGLISINQYQFFRYLFNKAGNNSGNISNNIAPAGKAPEIILPKVLYNLSGKITKIEKSAVTFNATISSKDSKGEIVSGVESRKANIDSSTVIKRLTFVKNSPVESEMKLGDLKINDYIEVVSGQDISVAKEFSVTLIRVLP